ncbi:carboxypeptidase-like regulatory domain-containing protein, partial [Zunongwangia atlantica 22II14-10F7]|uniref:carboxypeptidase-like regulatory domain-containing protein n=1 Tax=Zunongwangia atlantica TaxID=1502297 RepID=UPI003614A978
MILKLFLFNVAFLLVICTCYSQVSQIGTVKDSVNAPLHGANLIAIPDSDDLSMAFSISDEKGRYRLNL